MKSAVRAATGFALRVNSELGSQWSAGAAVTAAP